MNKPSLLNLFQRNLWLTLLSLPVLAVTASGWQPVPGKMMTRWAHDVTPKNVWPEYPRPQFERKNWENLNGLWEYAVTPKAADQPTNWQGKILVPFAIESSLSGVGKPFLPDQALWYRHTVHLKPKGDNRVLLNFEAVDYQATVWVNGQPVGEHIGGDTAFSFDITAAAKKGDNEIVVRGWDATDGIQLRGKQSLHPGAIFYTAVSGIWQTVWLEEVAPTHLADAQITTTISPAIITVTPNVVGATTDATVRVTALLKGTKISTVEGPGKLKLAIADAKLWSPAHPNLYDLQIDLLDAKGKVIDSVKSYAGIREVGKERDANGNWRFTLNGEEIFHFGTLDQGWWPDGLLTPPSDAAMRSDIDFLKAAGFNMMRKHVKVEPRRYYAYCDRVGMLMWQDQVACMGKSATGTALNPKWTRMATNPADAEWSDGDHAEWMKELKAMMDELHNQPCIVVWVPFNEAWGQHRTVEIGEWVENYDPTRLVDIASGGNFWPVGQMADNHNYPNPTFPFGQDRFNDYVKVVGEFGGHGWVEPGHLWDEKKRNWGYGGLPKAKDEYISRYEKSIGILADLKAKGVSGGVYTQTTDVEGELNGLMTYDRAVMKIPIAKLAELSQQLGPEIKR
jgi:beta-galactosidase/beta-glucuronidase